MISSLMFIWLRSTLPQFASYLSSFKTDPSYINETSGAPEAIFGCTKLTKSPSKGPTTDLTLLGFLR